MESIWKYEIIISDVVYVEMPDGAQLLSVQLQNDVPYIWAKVNTSKPPCKRIFRIYGTGHVHDKINGAFLGTIQLNGGTLVFHVFDNGYVD